MSIRKVPDDEVFKIPLLNSIVMLVKKQSGAKLSDYLAYIRENGENIRDEIDHVPSDEYTPNLEKNKGGHIIGDRVGSGSSIDDSTGLEGYPLDGETTGSDSNIGNSTGLGGYTLDGAGIENETHDEDGKGVTGGYTSDQFETNDDDSIDEEENSKEDEEDKKRGFPLLGKYAIKGAALGLAGLLLLAIGGTKQITHGSSYYASDYDSVEEVSDIELIHIDGKYVQYAGSVYQDPGKMIHDMRDAAIGEQNGNYEGIREYFSSQTDEERIAEEERILAISNEFQEQQRIISENEAVLRSSSSTDSEKIAALENIKESKSQMKGIYSENIDLYLKYTQAARNAYDSNSDDRTQQEKELTQLGQSEYSLAMQNLDLDIGSLQDSLYVLSHPDVLYKEPPAPEGTVDTEYIVDTSVFGHDIQFGMIRSTEVVGLEHDPAITVKKDGSTVTNGKVVISDMALQKTQTTRKGIFAVMDILARAINGEKIGEVSVFGNEVINDK